MASTSVGSIHYDLNLDTSKFDKAAAGISAKTKAIGTKMASVGKSMTTFVTLPVVAGMGFAVKAASDLNETMNKVDVAFKDQAATVKKWSETSIQSMGLAEQSALDAASLFGDMSTAMGLSTKEAAKMSMGLTQLGGDLASFKNISFDRAQTALAGVYTGETEALKGLGIVMTEANLAAFAQKKGIKENISEMTQAEKVQLRYKYVMDVTKNAQGDFARTAGGAANQMRITQEKVKQLSADVGQLLLPMLLKGLTFIQKWIDKFKALSPETQKWILIVAGIAAALGPVLLVMGNVIRVIGGIGTALKFLAMHPAILIFTLAVMAIAALAYVIIRNWDTLKRWFATFLGWIKTAWNVTWGIIKAVVGAVVGKIISDWRRMRDIVSGVFNFIKSAVVSRVNDIKSIFTAMKNHVVNVFNAIRNFIKARIDDIKGFIQGILDKAKSVMSGVKNVLTSPFTAAKNTIGGIMDGIKGAMDKINPWHRESPSLVDNIKSGTKAMVKNYAGALGKIRSMASNTRADLSGSINGGSSVNTSIYGNISIGSNADADGFMQRLSRNQELAFRSIATRPGAIG